MKEATGDNKRQFTRLAGLAILVLAFILVPFALFGQAMDRSISSHLQNAAGHRSAVAMILGMSLAADIFLPVPSSVISTACGLLLGLRLGTIVSLAGMTFSCVAGYRLAHRLGRPFAARFVGNAEMKRVEAFSRRFGHWAVILARPVPMLAEASVLFAGLGGMPFGRFLMMSTLSNLAISLVYAAVGATSTRFNAFLPAFAGSVLIPWLVMLAVRRAPAAATASE